MTFEEKTLKSERIYEGRIINLRRDTVTVINGESQREIVEHGGGAVIAAVKDDGKMIMVKQFRKPVERIMLEVPAGKLDQGEEPTAAALRELKEETGLDFTPVKADEMYSKPLFTTVGMTDESCATVYGYAYGVDKRRNRL